MSTKKILPITHLFLALFFLQSCSVIKLPYTATKTAIKTTYKTTKLAVKTTYYTGKTVYTVGEFTFKVVKAPLSWPLVHGEIDTIKGMPPKKAIQKGVVKDSPYTVRGKRYIPLSHNQAQNYREVGIASWYGDETLAQPGGHMTANGEKFDPDQLSAAHKHLPLPMYVRVTNLHNKRSIIVRVNDRGPFVPGRIIDLSAGAAKRLGFYRAGTARVLVEAIQIKRG